MRTPHQSLGALLAANAAAICFAISLFAFNAFSDWVELLFTPFATVIRWLGSMTFALYLFYQPLLSLFTVYHLPDRSSSAQLLLLVGSTFLIVITLGRFCENTKDTYKQWFLAVWPFLAAVFKAYKNIVADTANFGTSGTCGRNAEPDREDEQMKCKAGVHYGGISVAAVELTHILRAVNFLVMDLPSPFLTIEDGVPCGYVIIISRRALW
jgi:hypothetical protein